MKVGDKLLCKKDFEYVFAKNSYYIIIEMCRLKLEEIESRR